MKKILRFPLLAIAVLTLVACAGLDGVTSDNTNDTTDLAVNVTPLDQLEATEHFRKGALAHILEGELNKKGQAVGFHYEALPTRKGEVVEGSETEADENGIYEAKVMVSEVEKISNGGKSTFFPKNWDTQDVVDAINEAYDNRTFISGNTFEGVTDEGIIVHMYLDQSEKIISAFPVY